MAKLRHLAHIRIMDARGVHHRLARQTTLWLGAFAVLFGHFFMRYVVLQQPIMPPHTVGPLTFTPFGPLVAMGILFGIHLTRHWCQRFALEWPTMQVGLAAETHNSWRISCVSRAVPLMAL